MTLDVLQVSAAPEYMGTRHGQVYRDAIRRFAEERVGLAGLPYWVGRQRSRTEVLACAEECLAEHAAFAPDLTAELRAMGEAAGLSAAETLIVSGFTDFVDTMANRGDTTPTTPAPAIVDNCTATLMPGARTASGNALFAQTWDMHESAVEHVIVMQGQPDDAPAFTVFTSMGCLGMIGMNDAGITIGINNLSGADGRIGVTWNFIVRKVLQQTSYTDALACITDTPLAGAHNYLLLGPGDQGANIEATATRQVVTALAGAPLCHTNHCLADATRVQERPRTRQAQQDSEKRLARAHELLNDAQGVDMQVLAEFTRDTQAICYPPKPISRSATCGAVIVEPATRSLWALRGMPSEQRYERFVVG